MWWQTIEKKPDSSKRKDGPQRSAGEGSSFTTRLPTIPSCLLCPGEHLRICPQEYTCCSSEIEQKLTWETEATFRGLVEESGSFLVHTLAARHRRFDGEDLASANLASHLLSVLMTRASIPSLLLTLSLRHSGPGLAPASPP